jgi:ubiquinone/menaquinone biosynthesis C-methylase UbiE
MVERDLAGMSYDAQRISAFYDEYGEREWTRFEDDRNTRASLAVHIHYLRRFVRAGDLVLDIGAGPGRFTTELARIGVDVVVADLSPRQLELNEERLKAENLEHCVLERVLADVTDLSRFADGTFDAVVCYGGPVSYVVDRAEDAVAELVRVTHSNGHVLVSVMSLVGAISHYLNIALDLVRRDGANPMEEVVRTGVLPEKPDYGHLEMRLFRWRELEKLLTRHGTIVAAAAAGLLKIDEPDEPELRDLLTRLELDLGAEPGAIDGGEHMLAVLRKT